MNIAWLSLALFAAQPQAASSPFNGTWLAEIPSDKAAKPDFFSLRHGRFSRGDPKSRLTVKADGGFHPIASDGYVDAVAFTMLGPRKARELDRFEGKLVYSVTYSVSADGRTLTRKVVDFSKPDRKPIPTTITQRRIGRAECAGALLSGQWRTVGVTTTRHHMTQSLRLADHRFSSSGPGGAGYDAVVGGPPVPMAGDAADARVSVTMPNDRTVVVHMARLAVPTVEMTLSLLPDDRTIKVSALRLSDGVNISWLMHKQ
ncbi:MAG: hypothetical protein ABI471_06985 [Sphingomonas bacterium]